MTKWVRRIRGAVGMGLAWGALGGVLLTLFPVALVGAGLASTEGSETSLWRALAVVGGPFVLLSAASAAGTLLIARRAEGKDPGEVIDDMPVRALDEGKAQELPAGGSSTPYARPELHIRDRVPRSPPPS